MRVMFVCRWQKKREKERERERGRKKKKEKRELGHVLKAVCVHVCT